MDNEDYWSWYSQAFGPQPLAPPPAVAQPGSGPATPQEWAQFYQSVGIGSPVGQPPATRTVQSVPPPAPPNVQTVAVYGTRPMSYAGLEGGPPGVPGRLTPGSQGIDFAGGPGLSLAAVQGMGVDLDGRRTPPRVAPYPLNRPPGLGGAPVPLRPGRSAPMPLSQSLQMAMRRSPGSTIASLPTIAGRTAPVPMPASARPRRVAPVPFDRPFFGIGGPDLVPGAPRPASPGRPAAPRPQTAVVQALQTHFGVSPAQAYAMANAGNYQSSVEDRVTGRSSSSSSNSGTAQSISG